QVRRALDGGGRHRRRRPGGPGRWARGRRARGGGRRSRDGHRQLDGGVAPVPGRGGELTAEVRQVYPGGSVLTDAALAALYAYPDPGVPRGCWVRANMVASVDGAATLDGRAGGLSGEADEQVFAMLRALADVILVGAGTARAEGYGPVRPESEGLRWAWL